MPHSTNWNHRKLKVINWTKDSLLPKEPKINLANCLTPKTGNHRKLKVINWTKDSLLLKVPKISLIFTRKFNGLYPEPNKSSPQLEVPFLLNLF